MPAHYQANIRYHVIDKCLRDRTRVWHWKELRDAIADYLSEHQGKERELSRRTIMGDIQAMRSGVLGYEAPIEYSRTEGYRYFDPGFTIHKIQVPVNLLGDFEEALSLLKQNMGNKTQSTLVASLTRIAEHLRVNMDTEYKPIIYLEHSLNDPGYKWLDQVYHVIKSRSAVRIEYAPFDEPVVHHVVSPWFIKEYNNRWYVFGYHHTAQKIYNLALDRIAQIHPSLQPYRDANGYDFEKHFEYLYGVTIPDDSSPVTFKFETTRTLSRYMDTKPIHRTQKKEYEDDHKSIYTLRVYDNYEIRSRLRSFGDDLKVLSVG